MNGAGKTTLFRIITGLLQSYSGEITLFNKTPATIEEMGFKIGSLIENPTFYPNMTAKENLEISRLSRGLTKNHSIDNLLELVGLFDVDKKLFDSYSLGMKQRLGIANALLGHPKLLILDEPINGLDPSGIILIRNLLKDLNKNYGITILISSHLLSELSSIATCYGFLHKGILLEELTHSELEIRSKQHLELKVSNPKLSVILLEEQLNIKNYIVMPNNIIRIFERINEIGLINSTLVHNGIEVSRLISKGENLEDYFFQLLEANSYV